MLNDPTQKPDSKRHPLDDLFRKHVWVQIYLPILLFVIALAVLVTILWVNQQGSASVWADVSLVMLIIPTFILGLILLVILVGLTYGIFYLIGVLPDPFRRLHDMITEASAYVERGSNMAAKPIIAPRAAKAAMKEFFRGIISIFKLRSKE